MPAPFLYFDLGKVLLHFDHMQACRQMAEVSGVAAERVFDIVFQSDLQLRYERGEITTPEFFDEFCRQTNTQPDYPALRLAAADIFSLNADVASIVAQLAAAGFTLGLLSNTCEAHWSHCFQGRFPVLSNCFSIYVLSYQIGAAKPDAAIYQAAIERANRPAAEIFFVDDRPENVAGARRAGLDAVLYTTPSQLSKDLTARDDGFKSALHPAS